MPNRILAGPAGFEPYEPIQEILATGPVLPGHLITASGAVTSAGDELTSQIFVATEKGESNGGFTINDAYEVGDLIYAAPVRPGNLVWVRASAAVSTAQGTLYTAGANGRVVAVADADDVPLFAAYGNDINPTSVAADTLILVKRV